MGSKLREIRPLILLEGETPLGFGSIFLPAPTMSLSSSREMDSDTETASAQIDQRCLLNNQLRAWWESSTGGSVLSSSYNNTKVSAAAPSQSDHLETLLTFPPQLPILPSTSAKAFLGLRLQMSVRDHHCLANGKFNNSNVFNKPGHSKGNSKMHQHLWFSPGWLMTGPDGAISAWGTLCIFSILLPCDLNVQFVGFVFSLS